MPGRIGPTDVSARGASLRTLEMPGAHSVMP
jgi:hypothetical protein